MVIFLSAFQPQQILSGEHWVNNASNVVRWSRVILCSNPAASRNCEGEASYESNDTGSARRNWERWLKRPPLWGLSGNHTSPSGRRLPAQPHTLNVTQEQSLLLLWGIISHLKKTNSQERKRPKIQMCLMSKGSVFLDPSVNEIIEIRKTYSKEHPASRFQ